MYQEAQSSRYYLQARTYLDISNRRVISGHTKGGIVKKTAETDVWEMN